MRPPIRRRLSVCLRPKHITRYFIILSVPLFALALALVHGFAAASAPTASPASAASAPNGTGVATLAGFGVDGPSGTPTLNASAAAGIAASLAAPLAPPAFTSGDLVVYRVGDGSAALGSAATTVFLDEYATNGTLVQSIALPTAVSVPNKRLTASGTATTEGYLTRSTDGRYLILAGYDASVGTSGVTTSNSSSVNRVIGRVDASGTVDTTTALADNISPGNARGATSTNGTDMWMTTSSLGIRYATFGGTTSTQLSSSPTNTRATNIFNNQLYITSASGTFQGVATVGTGTPTASGQTTTLLPGFPTATGPSPHVFVFFNPSTVYVADDRAIASGGGLQKWTLTGGTWSLSKTFTAGLTTGLRGVTMSVNGSGQPVLWATTADSASKLVTVTDTGSAGDSFTTIATAGTNKAFRGVALAPSGATPTNFNLTVSTAGTGVGSVTSAPAGISCPTTCSASYSSGTPVTLTPTAGVNSAFTGWSGDCTGTGPCTVTMSAARSVTATFASTQRTLTVSRTGTGTGTVTSSPSGISCGPTCTATYTNGTLVTLTPTAGANSAFTGWVGCDSTSGNTCSVAMGADRAVTANFASTQRVLSVSRTGTGTGTVTSSPAGINCGPTCSATYADGTGVTLTPAADANSTFAGWSGACTGTGPCSLTMDGDKSVTATFNFVPPPTTVKISQVYGGGGNSGSTYTNDFIELYNSGSTPVTINGWSVQDTSAAGTDWNNATNGPPTPLSGTIQPGHYYLIQGAVGLNGTTPLPTPDVVGSLSLSGTNSKVALVASTTPLSGPCPLGGLVVDFVGYGSANCAEGGAAAPVLTNTTAAVRRGNGCTDTDNNHADFVTSGPIPRNSSSPVNQCGGDPTQPSGLGIASPAALDPSGNTLLTVNVTPASAPPSTDITVNGDLTSIGGAASQQFYDDGTNGDATAGDKVFSFRATVAPSITTGAKSIVATITDAQARIATAPITLTVQSPSCGVERWTVKVGTDPDAAQVNLDNPVHTTIQELGAITPPADPPGPPDNSRIQPTEGTVYVVDATMTFYKKETDVDYHIVLQDSTGHTMIAEIPFPACTLVPNPSGPGRIFATSPFEQGITNSRAKFDGRFTATTFFQTANVPVRVKGVAFFDFQHGQTGVAPNGIELHPVLDINFTANTSTTLMSSANPSQYGQQVAITATVSNGGAAATPTGSVTFFDGGSPIDTVALDQNGQATFTTSTLSVGPHSITASYEGDDASAPSTSSALSQVVNKADQTITFPAIAPFTWVGGSATLNATASSGLTVTYSVLSGPCSVTGDTLTATAAGSCVVAADQAGDSNYNAAPQTTATATANKADQAITFGALSDKTYGDAPFTVSATGGASGNPVTFVAAGSCTSGGTNGSTITINGAGPCTVTASQAGDSNYNAAPDVPQSFNVNKATAIVSVSGYTGVYDGSAHGATGSATGVGGEDLSGLLNLGANFTNVPGGAANWSFAGNTNYNPASGTVSIIITRATPAFSNLSSPVIGCGTATVSLSGRITSGPLVPTGVVAVTLNGVTQNAAIQPDGSFSSAFATGSLTPAGSPFAVTFSYGGDGNFNPAGGASTLAVFDSVPPTITLNGNVISLWPANKQVYTINVTDLVAGASDGCDAGVNLSSVVISQVSSDEGAASGGDIVIAADCRSVQLRAERDGNGDGRVYTITFRVRDAFGNTTTAAARVIVPHDQGQGNNAVDSGPAYTVSSGCP